MCLYFTTHRKTRGPPSKVLLISAFHVPTAEYLYLSLFVCLLVRSSGYGEVTPVPISTFFQYIQALRPHINPVPPNSKQYQVLLTQHHQVLTSTAPYWPSNIMNQPVMLHTDPVLLDINQLRPILSQYHQVWTSSAPYWPSTTKYQPVPHSTDTLLSYIIFKCQTFLCLPKMSTVVR